MRFFKIAAPFGLLSLILLLAACTGSKKGYTITGSLPADLEADSVYLYSYDGKKLGGAKVENGKFELKGVTDGPAPATILKEEVFKVDIILENENINVKVKDLKSPAEITGSKTYDLLYAYEKDPEHKKLTDNYESFSNSLFADLDENDEAKVAKARKELGDYEERIFKIRDEFLNRVINGDNPPITKTLAYTMAGRKGLSNKEYIANLKKMNEEAGSKYIEYSIKSIEDEQLLEKNAENVAVGKQFIDVAGKNLEGKEVKLSEYIAKNNYTILEFWASWCVPCRSEIPNLKKAYAKYKGKGLEIVSFSVDEKHEEWIKATKEEQQPWINAIVNGGFESKEIKQYGIQGIPANYLIDKDGKIVASNLELREFQLDKTLSKFIK